ncbi:hypothetical protein KCP77_18415 [Salmonella enterica subsp. enterica]|nr:hypothetical protein KCP77_18415 [Salmonella enterica subsp. enterica]
MLRWVTALKSPCCLHRAGRWKKRAPVSAIVHGGIIISPTRVRLKLLLMITTGHTFRHGNCWCAERTAINQQTHDLLPERRVC